ncbi:endonuclease Q family protein [Marininema halotolerans]|uniref:TIGR00375 family protein n=1 Tax=Marininema halotolerans TaxID=1155944 RepID=A0A1I6TT77_9BACL|nr:endonuclease Q family protein [Marininema halotolerans]SFS92396.1 TIGR00375 family protein [Marininema halotolerans]
MNFPRIFADLHIHIGWTANGLPVKVTGSRKLTFANILQEASHRKGMDMVGIIDAHSPPVIAEIEEGIADRRLKEHQGGGLLYQGTTAILGTEIELRGTQGLFHVLTYVPDLMAMKELSHFLARYMKNPQLSTQRFHGGIDQLVEKVQKVGGIVIPAHVFTPFKSVYGSACHHITELFEPNTLAGIELGLSCDTAMADQIEELASFTFLSNSDAHSLGKIGREYNEIALKESSFSELKMALMRQDGRQVTKNYGLDPKLGKYYRTRCANCGKRCETSEVCCAVCKSPRIIKGVSDRIAEIATPSAVPPSHRAPYIYQVPLEFIPKVGPKTLDKLFTHFGTEMTVIHRTPLEAIARLVGEPIAKQIGLARENCLVLEEGGGGVYGRIAKK